MRLIISLFFIFLGFLLTQADASSMQDIQETIRGHCCRMSQSERGEDEQEINKCRHDKEPSKEELNDAILHFLKEFPNQREEIEECIRCLGERADTIDKTHKNCKIAGLASSSTSAASGILSIVGFSLAPVTAGGCLILTAIGIGVGMLASATGFGASVSEGVIRSNKRKNIEKIIKQCDENLRTVMSLDKIGCISGLHSDGRVVEKAPEDNTFDLNKTAAPIQDMIDKGLQIAEHINALKNAKACPALTTVAKKATSLGSEARNAIKGIDQLDDAFKGTALAMSKGARVAGIAVSGVFIGVDACFIIADSMELASGAKTEEAAKVRDTANKLEAAVQKLDKLHEELKDLWV
uniref:Uncharacterized protein n=1 Tax=Salvator merianae TaxID=96440 RepID=A0A8D0CAI2_SALMN